MKDFYVIPSEYLQEDTNGNSGFYKAIFGASGTSAQFVMPEIFNNDGEYCYIDCDEGSALQPGDYVMMGPSAASASAVPAVPQASQPESAESSSNDKEGEEEPETAADTQEAEDREGTSAGNDEDDAEDARDQAESSEAAGSSEVSESGREETRT